MNRKGYTIGELVLAVILLTAFLLINISLYTNSLKNVKEAERLSKAIEIAVEKTEQIQGQNYNDVNTQAKYLPFADNENYTVTVTVDEDEEQLTVNGTDYFKVFKNVIVLVEYKVAGQEKQIELKSLKVNDNLFDAIYGENTI